MLLFIFILILTGCNQSDSPDIEEVKDDKYTIKIGDEVYNLHLNYLSEDEIYIASNINVEAEEEVSVFKNDVLINVSVDNYHNNVVNNHDILKIHNNATSQIVLTTNEVYTLTISGYNGSYDNFVGSVKEGFVTAYSIDNHISYIGYIKNGLPHGEGIYIWSLSNCIYFGEFADGKYDGEGTFIWHNGDKLVGEFSKGNPVNGVYTYASSGCTYTGAFNSNWKYDGEGVFTWLSGWKFEGEFVDGKATNGKTTTTKEKGLTWFEGAMNDLNNINSSVLGFGRFIQTDGIIYEGQMYASGALESCVYSGEGKLIYPNGTEVSGTFSNGQLVSSN